MDKRSHDERARDGLRTRREVLGVFLIVAGKSK